jgi:hypothetical protein
MVGEEFKLNCLKSADISPLSESNIFYIIFLLHMTTSPLLLFSRLIYFLLLCVTGTFDALNNQTKHIQFHFIILDNYKS